MLAILSSSAAFGQENRLPERKVPTVILKDLAKKFPEKWQLRFYQSVEDSILFIEVEFKVGKQQYDLTYLPNGNQVEEERELCFNQKDSLIYESINQQLRSTYGKFRIKKTQIVNENTASSFYELNITSKGRDEELYFDLTGKLLQTKEIIYSPISTQF